MKIQYYDCNYNRVYHKNITVYWLAFLLYIQETLGLILSWEIGCPEVFHGLSEFIHPNPDSTLKYSTIGSFYT
jgi:hypothetical protein